jgi:hypothetical protein
MRKPQKPKKREDDLGSRRYDWKDWEKGHNYMTGYSFNRMYDVYQQNELLRVRNDYNIQSMQEDVDKIQKTNRKRSTCSRTSPSVFGFPAKDIGRHFGATEGNLKEIGLSS